jgi:hypothetical protein
LPPSLVVVLPPSIVSSDPPTMMTPTSRVGEEGKRDDDDMETSLVTSLPRKGSY